MSAGAPAGPDPVELRDRLRRARLALLFTPKLCRAEPLETLAAALPWVDMVQVRIEHPEHPDWVAPAAELYDWTRRVLELLQSTTRGDVLVVVNDRVDVAAHLLGRGAAGVHLGATDCPPRVARRILGPVALLGLSTHAARDLAAAEEEPVDYLGFGPIHATRTKGYSSGLGSESAWIAANATDRPLFPIGGIDAENAGELASVGRAAVSSAILAADDPGQAARTLRRQLEGDGGA